MNHKKRQVQNLQNDNTKNFSLRDKYLDKTNRYFHEINKVSNTFKQKRISQNKENFILQQIQTLQQHQKGEKINLSTKTSEKMHNKTEKNINKHNINHSILANISNFIKIFEQKTSRIHSQQIATMKIYIKQLELRNAQLEKQIQSIYNQSIRNYKIEQQDIKVQSQTQTQYISSQEYGCNVKIEESRFKDYEEKLIKIRRQRDILYDQINKIKKKHDESNNKKIFNEKQTQTLQVDQIFNQQAKNIRRKILIQIQVYFQDLLKQNYVKTALAQSEQKSNNLTDDQFEPLKNSIFKMIDKQKQCLQYEIQLLKQINNCNTQKNKTKEEKYKVVLAQSNRAIKNLLAQIQELQIIAKLNYGKQLRENRQKNQIQSKKFILI